MGPWPGPGRWVPGATSQLAVAFSQKILFCISKTDFSGEKNRDLVSFWGHFWVILDSGPNVDGNPSGDRFSCVAAPQSLCGYHTVPVWIPHRDRCAGGRAGGEGPGGKGRRDCYPAPKIATPRCGGIIRKLQVALQPIPGHAHTETATDTNPNRDTDRDILCLT